jgi:hypothetical protein
MARQGADHTHVALRDADRSDVEVSYLAAVPRAFAAQPASTTQGEGGTPTRSKMGLPTFLQSRLWLLDLLACALMALVQSWLFWLLFKPSITWPKSLLLFAVGQLLGTGFGIGADRFLEGSVVVAYAVAVMGALTQCFVAMGFLRLHGRLQVAVTVLAVTFASFGLAYGLTHIYEPAVALLPRLWLAGWLGLSAGG